VASATREPPRAPGAATEAAWPGDLCHSEPGRARAGDFLRDGRDSGHDLAVTNPDNQLSGDLRVDAANLYREDVFTDLQVATLRRLTPVKPDGTDDASRPVLFVAATQIMSQVGAVPISAPVEAKDLNEAIAKFPDAIRAAVQEMVEEAREMQRRESSRLVVPGPGSIPPAGKGPISLR
jgi:hypothetical protein